MSASGPSSASLTKDNHRRSDTRPDVRHTLTTDTHPTCSSSTRSGYLTYGLDAANVLSQVVNDRYLHQRPMIFTTNKPLAARCQERGCSRQVTPLSNGVGFRIVGHQKTVREAAGMVRNDSRGR